MRAAIEPMRFVNGWRVLNISVLIYLWIVGDSVIPSFVLILLLLVLASLRWRFRLPSWVIAIDALICFLYFPITDISYYALALPIFELALTGSWPLAVLLSASLYFSLHLSPYLSSHLSSDSISAVQGFSWWHPAPGFWWWHPAQALFFGISSYYTLLNYNAYKQEVDDQRKARYELERLQSDLLEASGAAAHQAELMERQRISRQLHDHLGHDLTGAALALQAYEYVEAPEEARRLLQEVQHRLDRSTQRLRDTVHNVAPTAMIGVDSLEHAVRNFRLADIQFHKAGNMQLVPAHIWGLLEACLKEALTNIARHSNATSIEIELQVSEAIARLMVRDDGTVQSGHIAGSYGVAGGSGAGSHDGTTARGAGSYGAGSSSGTAARGVGSYGEDGTRSASSYGAGGSGLRSLQLRARALSGSLSISHGEGGFLLVCVIPLQ